jgi:hypothetical protein
MCESYPHNDDFDEERVIPTDSVPVHFSGHTFTLTPANAAIRLFSNEEMGDYSRVIIYHDDETATPFKPDDDLLKSMVTGGFPVELPEKLDDTDHEFMSEFMKIWTEDAKAELGIDC